MQKSAIRCCVVCTRSSPKTIFSCRYKVHERNVLVLKAHFGRDLEFGELCDRCYRIWYKHKRGTTKSSTTSSKQKSKVCTLIMKNLFQKKKHIESTISSSGTMSDDTQESYSTLPQKQKINSFMDTTTTTTEEEPVAGGISSGGGGISKKKRKSTFMDSLLDFVKRPRKSKRKSTPQRCAPYVTPLDEWYSCNLPNFNSFCICIQKCTTMHSSSIIPPPTTTTSIPSTTGISSTTIPSPNTSIPPSNTSIHNTAIPPLHTTIQNTTISPNTTISNPISPNTTISNPMSPNTTISNIQSSSFKHSSEMQEHYFHQKNIEQFAPILPSGSNSKPAPNNQMLVVQPISSVSSHHHGKQVLTSGGVILS